MARRGLWAPTPPNSPVFVTDGTRPHKLGLKPLLVGAELRQPVGPWGPLVGRPMVELAALFGTSIETFLCLFDRTNFLRHWTPSHYPRESSAKVIAEDQKLRGSPLIFLGESPARAFGYGLTYFTWEGLRGKPATMIPSLGARAYLRGEAVARTAKVLREALLYHGRTFRIGEYPYGYGAELVVTEGDIWGEAASRQRHKTEKPPVVGV